MASSNGPPVLAIRCRRTPKKQDKPDSLGDWDNMPTNTTDPSLQPKEDMALVPSNTESALPDHIEGGLEAAGGSSGKASVQGSSSVQQRPTNEVKSVDVAILLQTIQSQQELQKTFEKQLEESKNQLELLY
jgi:hypothetical protein